MLRGGLGLLAASAGLIGVWALLAPQSFFDDFPGSGLALVSALPPYNEHLIRDYGSMNLALAFVLAIGAATLSRWVVIAGLGAVLINGVPHLIFHAGHQGTLSDSDQTSQLIALALPVIVAAALLVLVWMRENGERTQTSDGRLVGFASGSP